MNEFLQFSDGGSTEAPDDPDWSDGEGTATVIAENSLNLRTQPVSSATVVTRIPGALLLPCSARVKLGPRCAMAANLVTA